MRKFSLFILPLMLVSCLFLAQQSMHRQDPMARKQIKLDFERGEEGKRPDKPGEAQEYWDSLHETPNHENPAVLNRDAARILEANRAKRATEDLVPLRFDILGPGNFAGRIRGLVVKPSDPDTLLVGSVSGGIWKTTNGGKFWRPVSSYEPSLAISHLLVDPDNENRVFAGTGEGFQNGFAARGLGILVSEDFGETWQQLASTNNDMFYYVNRLARIPQSQIILAATGSGIYRSTDLGQTWTDVDGLGISTARGFVDIKVSPSDPSIALAAYYGQIVSGDNSRNYIMRSQDGGLTWTRLRGESGLPTFDISRHEIAFGSDGTVYIAVADNTNSAGTNGLFKSSDGGNQFQKAASTEAFIERQGWYDLMVAVDPSDSSRVYTGAIDVFRTTDSGTTLTQLSEWNPAPGQVPEYVHADIHTLTFHPTDPQTFWIGCDGGIFKSTNGGDSFEQVNGNLSITQFYGIAVHPNGDQAIGGTQDNGTVFYYQDDVTWLEWVGGDGGYAAWDQQDPNYIYGSTPNGGMFGSNMSVANAFSINLPNTAGAPFIQPFTLDPNDGNRMLVGTRQVFFSSNIRNISNATWATSPTSFPNSLRSTTISPHDGSRAYVGDTAGRVYATNDLGGSNEFSVILNQDYGLSDITWIEVDPNDANHQTLYATLGDYSPDRIVVTRDGGQTWASLQGNLPEFPVFCVRVDPQNPKRLFLGTEMGLWTTPDATQGTPVWTRYDYGTAFTRVLQLHWNKSGSQLWLGTYGRGMIKANRQVLDAKFETMLEASGDSDGILDIGERQTLQVTLQNLSGSAIDDIQVTLVGMDQNLEVLNPPLKVAQIAGNQATVLPFTIALNDWEPGKGKGTYRLIVEHDGLTYHFDDSFDVAADPLPRTDDFIDGGEGPSLLTHSALLGADDWATVTTRPHSGNASWYAANTNGLSNKSLTTPWFEVLAGDANFSFWLAYDLEGDSTQRWDGTVLELRTPDGEWVDAGSQSGIPYDGPLFQNSPLQFRQAWSGTQTTYRQGNVSLGNYQGQSVQLRFTLACDNFSANDGVWIDDIRVSGVQWQDRPSENLTACSECPTQKGTTLAQIYTLAEANTSGGGTTAMGIVNTNSGEQPVVVTAFASNGAVRGIHEAVIPANGKLWTDLDTLFPQTKDQISWVQIGCGQPLEVFGEIQRPGVRSAYLAANGYGETVYLPHVGKNTALFQTYIASVNGQGQSATTQITPSGGVEVNLANPHEAYAKTFHTAVDLFGSDLSTVDWAVLGSTQSNLAAMEFFSTLPEESRIASLGLTADRGNQLRFLHIAKDIQNFWTGLVYFNLSDQTAHSVETYYNDNGEVVDVRMVDVPAFAKEIRLFDAANIGVTVPNNAAWLDVQGDQNLIGYELFGTPSGNANDFFVGLQGEYSQGTELIYPHMESDGNHFTGIVALNLGDTPASITFTLYDSAGQVLDTSTQSNIDAKTKITLLVRTLFSEQALANGAWIRAVADGSQWAGFLLWGDLTPSGRENLSGIKAGLR